MSEDEIDQDVGAGYGENPLQDVGKDVDEGTDPKQGFESLGFLGGIFGPSNEGAIDDGPFTGPGDDPPHQLDADFESLVYFEATCGDSHAGDWAGAPLDDPDVHIIACTNEDLSEKLASGDFSAIGAYKKIFTGRLSYDFLCQIQPINII